MWKKPLVLIGLLGLLLIIGGLILSPSLIGKFSHDGKINSYVVLAGIFLIQFYMITLGSVIILESIIFNFLPPEKRTAQYFIGLFILGLIILITGVVFSPSFIEQQLNLFKVEEERFGILCNIQLAVIIIGFLISFVSLYLYRRKSAAKKLVSVFQIILCLIFLVLVDVTFINSKYPSNILTKPNEYSKVFNLLLGRDILLTDFSPQSSLKVERKQILKAKYPVIDIHFHLASPFMTEEDKRILAPENLTKTMDSLGLKMIVGFDATDLNLETLLEQYQKKYPGRFLVCSDMLSIQGRILPNEFLSSLPSKLDEFKKMGMQAIGEFPKDLGLKMKDPSGKLIPFDDPRMEPFFEKAGELGLPVIMHTADPTSFFQPVDRFNERISELGKYSFWSYVGPNFPTKEKLLKERENVLKKHPNTIFVGCHFGSNPEDLNYVAYLLDTYPNYYVDISAVLSDLGRQPFTARKFFIKYQDRILFGSDGGVLFGLEGWTIEKVYRSYFEFLETENEYVDYPQKGAINQGNWEIYGINLPDEVLEKIYYKNAEKILIGNVK